jgi:hypothetical protein
VGLVAEKQPPAAAVRSLADYLANNSYRSLIAFSLIFMFSLVFYLIYLLVDALVDKQKHYALCVRSFERYEKRCRGKPLKAKKAKKSKGGDDERKLEINIETVGDEPCKEIGKAEFEIFINR